MVIFLIIKYEDIKNAIDNYWNKSEILQELINKVSFDDLKTININKQNLKKILEAYFLKRYRK